MLPAVELPDRFASDAICPDEGGPGIDEPKPPPPKPQFKAKHKPRLPNPAPPNAPPPPNGPPTTMTPPPVEWDASQIKLMSIGSIPDGSTTLKGLLSP